ncbi:MAG: ABC transporter substrate-binding protein [Sedimenticola sp.]
MRVGIHNLRHGRRKPALIKRWLLILLIGLTCFGNLPAATEPPLHLVIDATENLVNQLKTNGDAIGNNPRLAFELANEDIIPLIDFPTIARSVLGHHWQHASPEHREDFVKDFRTFIINLYTTAMVTYSQEIVTTADSFRFSSRGWRLGDTRATVIMEFKLKGTAPVKVGYNMHWKGNTWKVYDVHVLGISVVSLYRKNFDAEIRRHGLSGLLKRLAAKNRTGTFSAFIDNSNFSD